MLSTTKLTKEEMAAMGRDQILERLRALMLDRFEVEPQKVQLDTKLVEDLDLDSIDAIDMAVELQGWTGVPLAEEALRAVKTVDDVVGMIATHLAKVASGELQPPAAPSEEGSAAGTSTAGTSSASAGSGAEAGPRTS